jgi:hypothetical protein
MMDAMTDSAPNGANRWRLPEHALAYLDHADTVPQRAEGEAAVLECGDGRLVSLVSMLHPTASAVALDFSESSSRSLRERTPPPRVPGSCGCVQRRRPARNPEGVRGVLHAFAHALSLEKDAPCSRPISPHANGPVIAIAQVGGLHHRYERRAA